jgi:hypothetical protein
VQFSRNKVPSAPLESAPPHHVSYLKLHGTRVRFVGVGRLGVLFHVALFVDDGRNDREVRCFDHAIEPIEKRRAGVGIAQNIEIPVFLPNLAVVEHHAIMAPKIKLEPLEHRHDAVDVSGLMHQAKGQHEHRMLRVD